MIWSFSFRWAYPALLPEWGASAWAYVFGQGALLDSAFVSVVLSAVVTLFALILGFSTARALGTREFRGKSAVEVFVLLPAIVPVISAVMGMQGIFIRLGISDTFLGVVLAQLVFTLPYTVMGLATVFKNYNPEYEQQARTLGAGEWDVLVRITLPAIFPGLVVSGLFAFIVSWSQYLLTIVIGGPSVTTLAVMLFALMGSGEYAVASAVSIVFIVPVLLLLVLTSRFLTESNAPAGGISAV